jgi:hypothetical protein
MEKGLAAWLKWWNVCVASTRPGVQLLVTPKEIKIAI